jgi:hypothetical protein
MGFGCGPTSDELVAKVFENFCKFLRRNLNSAQDVDWVLVAQDDELAGVFDGVKSAAANFVKEPLATYQTFQIHNLSTDYAAFGNGFGVEKLDYPAVRSDVNR